MLALLLATLAAAGAAAGTAAESPPPGEEPGFSRCRPQYRGPSDDRDRNLAVLEFWHAFYGKIPKDCGFDDTRACVVAPAHVFQWEINHGCEGHPDCKAIFVTLFNRATELVAQRKRLRCDARSRELLRRFNHEKRNLGKWIKCEWRYCHGGMTCISSAGFRYPISVSLERTEQKHLRGPWVCGRFLCGADPPILDDAPQLTHPCPMALQDLEKFCRMPDGRPVAWRGDPAKGFVLPDNMWGSGQLCRNEFPVIERPTRAMLQKLIDSAGAR